MKSEITKTLLALALGAFAAVAFAGQENKSPIGGKGDKSGYGQQQPQRQPRTDDKRRPDAGQDQQDDERERDARKRNEQPK